MIAHIKIDDTTTPFGVVTAVSINKVRIRDLYTVDVGYTIQLAEGAERTGAGASWPRTTSFTWSEFNGFIDSIKNGTYINFIAQIIADELNLDVAEDQGSYNLTITKDGGGEVTLDPAEGPYPNGSIVTLEATPGEGWFFDKWRGSHETTDNPMKIHMNEDKVYMAKFKADPDNLTVSIEIEGEGSVSGDEGTDGVFKEGDTVTLTAEPAEGWEFSHWDGNFSSDTNPMEFTITTHRSFKAVFREASETPAGEEEE